jgi:hypothetical protein
MCGWGAHCSIVVKGLCYKPQGRRFETQWGEWLLSICLSFPATPDPGGSLSLKRCVRRLLVTANVVHSSPILITLMMGFLPNVDSYKSHAA